MFGIKIQLTDDEVFPMSPSTENKYNNLESPKVFSQIHILSSLDLICLGNVKINPLISLLSFFLIFLWSLSFIVVVSTITKWLWGSNICRWTLKSQESLSSSTLKHSWAKTLIWKDLLKHWSICWISPVDTFCPIQCFWVNFT